MSDYLPAIGIFSKTTNYLDTLIIFFEERNFDVRKNPTDINEVDYFIIDFSSGLEFADYADFISTVGVKCLLLVDSKDTKVATKALEINPNVSVGKIKTNIYKVFDYSEAILKELLSFGHDGKIFNLKGVVVKTIWPTKPVKKITLHPKKEKNKHALLPRKTLIEPIRRKNNKKNYSLKHKLSNIPFKKLSLISGAVLFVLLMPAMSLFASSVFFYVSIKTIFSNKALSSKLLGVSQTCVDVVKVVNFGFNSYTDTAEILDQSIQVTKNGFEIIDKASVLSSSISGNEIYNLKDISTRLSAELDSLYVNLGFLKGLVDNIDTFPGSIVRKRLAKSNVDIETLAKKIYSGKEIASNLNSILGGDSPKKYLILFQNNMELRPTGGFIGSFALLTLDGGRLVEITVSDVYSADGQLKGHVDPPAPIRDVLGEGGWYLRDANWDPDFPTSASKIEWFLDKEINTKVDGVVAIDLQLVQDLLDVTGPITLPEFNKIITSQNLYETTQSEVENEFFPGSTKKASFLTALSRQLITRLEDLEESKKPQSLIKIAASLEEGHTQVFVHDANVQKTLNSLGYDGTVDVSTFCGLRCLWDRYYLIDANLGVNKANYYIDRSHELFIKVGNEKITHELLVTYTNNSKQLLGSAGLYKTYTRLIVPQSANIGGIRIYQKDGSYNDVDFVVEDISGRREVGFTFEVLPESIIKLQMTWDLANQPLSQGGEYRLVANKQSGTDKDPLSVSLKGEGLTLVASIPLASLTQEGSYIYNTDLRKDFFVKSFFK